jgi:AcrR family transcriptional regulator
MARGLTAELAVAAAIELADESGLAAVTMAAVARRCGFTTMSLYRHVASKDDLLRRMLDVVLGAPPPFDTSDWRAGLAAWSQAMLDVLARHPWGIDIPITGKLDTHAQLAWLDRGLEAMAGTGLHEGDKAEIVLVLNGFVFWSARLRASITEDPGEAVVPASFDLTAYPSLMAMLGSGVFDDQTTPEEEFGFGLELILDGVAALIQRSSPRPVPPSLPRTSSK